MLKKEEYDRVNIARLNEVEQSRRELGRIELWRVRSCTLKHCGVTMSNVEQRGTGLRAMKLIKVTAYIERN